MRTGLGIRMHLFFIIFALLRYHACDVKAVTDSDKLLVITVATNETDGYRRFIRSANIYGLDVEVLGMHGSWKGGDVQRLPGGGHKVNLLKEALPKYKDNEKLVIMFVDSYDVVFTTGGEKILERFYKTNSKALFSAEGFCWPDRNLAEKYPQVESGSRYVNSGGFMGYAPVINEIVNSSEISNLEDDQLFYTKLYLDDAMRKKWSVKLDHKAEIFQNLNGAVGDVELHFSDNDATVHNTAFGTNPLVIHGNGKSKSALNSLSNYLAKAWTMNDGCNICNEDKISLSSKKVHEMPVVIMAIFIENPTPFLPEFFQRLLDLNYPKEKIDLYVHNNVEYHTEAVEQFLDKHKHKFKSAVYLRHDDGFKEWHARNLGLEQCIKLNCDYYFSVDSDARLTDPNTLRDLIEQNRSIISPMLVRPGKLWSNFWGALSSDGFYARSHDYVELAQNNRRGVWNVPFVSTTYLIQGNLLKSTQKFPSFISGLLDPDMAFCKNLRDKDIFMFSSNVKDYGHLVNSETFDTSLVHPELHEIYSNQIDWEDRYIHENYSHNFLPDHKLDMPCPDVYWFPVVTPTFCKHLIDVMETYGKWSGGTNSDTRLAGGYENVPTRDIHMNQVGLEQQWLYFLREYIRPVQEKVFIGYFHDPPKAIMNFVVRYKLDEQASLRPHHDSSTYTINIALNTRGKDYEGGGCRFIRYNCSVVDLRLGWSLIHPGRLTHYHEGLKIASGIRYIMVSFVDP